MRVCIAVENGKDENEWDYALSNIAPTEIHFLDVGYQPTNNMLRDLPLLSNLSSLPDVPLVLMAPTSSRNFTPSVSLLDFTHPEDAIYIFGPNNQHLTDEDMAGRVPDHVVHIPTDTIDEMFSYSCYLITAWHRRHG